MTAITVSKLPEAPIITCICCKLVQGTIKLYWKELKHIDQTLAICDDCCQTLEKDLSKTRKAK